MDISDPQTPTRLDPDSEEGSPSPLTDRNSPIIPPEDSYFTDITAAHPRPVGLRDFRNLGVILNNRRRATQHVTIRGVGTAWIDQDDSGTYDPSKERATPPVTPPRRRKSSRIYDDEDEDDRQSPKPRKSHRPVGYRSLLTFSFTSKKALEYLQSISPGPFDCQSATPEDDFSDILMEPEDGDLFGPPLHHRKTRRSMRQRGHLPRVDGLTLDQLTLGHPQRRGCKACFEVGDDRCSLIEDIHDYPCTACDDAGFDCELIIPPELKKSCERCKQKRISCSYRVDGGKGVRACGACEEADARCIAAPLKSSAMLGRGATHSSSPAPPARERVYVACNQCRMGSKRCNLKRRQAGPCINCKKSGDECAFVLVPVAAFSTSTSVTPPAGKSKRSQKKNGKKLSHRETKTEQDPDSLHTPGNANGRLAKTLRAEAFHYGYSRHKESTLRNERERAKSRATKKQQKIEAAARKRSSSYIPELSPPLGITFGIQHVHIKTAFSHPIIFNYIADPAGASPCSWCSSPFFGLFGHGEVEVEVIPYPQIDGNGYEEILAGHHCSGKGRSQMCIACTFERVQIMGCEKHDFAAMELDPRLLVHGEMERSVQALLLNDKKGGELAEKTKWCSICPSPAYLRCCTMQPRESAGLEVENEGSGCGLLVCEICADLLTKISKDSRNAAEALDRTVNIASKDLFNYEYGARADAKFLTSTGELMIRIQKGFGEEPAECKQEAVESSAGEEDDDEVWSILERMGKGKGKWNEKMKGAAAVKNPESLLSSERLSKGRRTGLKQSRIRPSGGKSKASRGSQSQTGLGSWLDEFFGFEAEDRGCKKRKTGHGGESSDISGRDGSKGQGKAEGEDKHRNQVIVLSDEEDD